MEEIINNIMQSPENTNPNVLRSQLQSINSSFNSSIIIECTPDNPSNLTVGTWSSDYTYNQLVDIFISGVPIFAHFNTDDTDASALIIGVIREYGFIITTVGVTISLFPNGVYGSQD